MSHLIAQPAAAREPAQTHSFNGRYILLISAVPALGGVLFGFGTAIISGAIPFITNYFGLDEARRAENQNEPLIWKRRVEPISLVNDPYFQNGQST